MLGLALWSGLHEEAGRLLGAGANINEKNSEGMTLLHQAIEKQDTSSALFLIEHKADLTIKYISECLPVTCSINHVYNDVSVYKRKAFVHVSENEYLKRQVHFTFKNQN